MNQSRIPILILTCLCLCSKIALGQTLKNERAEMLEPEIKIQLSHSTAISALSFSPDGKYLITGDRAGMIKVWDLSTNKLLRDIYDETGNSIQSIDISTDGKYFATGYIKVKSENVVTIRCIENGLIERSIPCDEMVLKVKFAKTSGILLISGTEKTILYDYINNQVLFEKELYYTGDISHAGDKMALKNIEKGTIEISSFPRGKKLGSIKNMADKQRYNEYAYASNNYKFIHEIFFNAENSLSNEKVAIRDFLKGTVELFSFKEGEKMFAKENIWGNDYIQDLIFSNDDRYLLEIAEKEVCIYDVKQTKKISGITFDHVISAIFSVDSKYIITSSSNDEGLIKEYNLTVWDINGNKVKHLKPAKETVGILSLHPVQNTFLCADYLPSESRMAINIDFFNLNDFSLYNSIKDIVSPVIDAFITNNNLTIAYRKNSEVNNFNIFHSFNIFSGKDLGRSKTKIYDAYDESGKIGITLGRDTHDSNYIYLSNVLNDSLIQSIALEEIPTKNSAFIIKNNKLLYHPFGEIDTEELTLTFQLYLYDILSGKLIRKFKETKASLIALVLENTVSLLNDNKTLVRVTQNGIEYIDIDTEQLISTIQLENVIGFKFFNDQSLLFVKSYNAKLRSNRFMVFDSNGKELFYKATKKQVGMDPIISSDGKYLCINYGEEIYIINLKSGLTESKLSPEIHSNPLLFSECEKYLITYTANKEIQLWDIKSNELLVTRIESRDFDDYILITPDNYYMTSTKGTDLVHFVVDNKIYPFDQFDIIFNRPDKVMERFPYSDPMLIRAYHKAYEKRLRKLGFKEENLSAEFHLPHTQIKNKNEISFKTTKSEIDLDLEFSDSKYYLNKFNVWINNVPVYGSKGISISREKTKLYESSLKLNLARGTNKIQISCMNEKATESLKETFTVVYEPKTIKKQDLYIVSIGVSEFEESIYNLEYATKDATDISMLFQNKKNQFNEIHDIRLFDNDATVENILEAKKKLMQSNVDDLVIVFVASHGLLDENMDYFIATHDIEFRNPSVNGLAYEDLESLLDGIPSKKKLMLIDACHSGEVDKEDDLILANNTNDENITFRGNESLWNFSNSTNARSSNTLDYRNTFELMKSLFVDLRRGTGAVVISSAGGGEFAYEGEQWNNGVFTYSFIEGLTSKNADSNKDGEIRVSEIRDYVFNSVSRLTYGRQNPTARRDNIEFDFTVWE